MVFIGGLRAPGGPLSRRGREPRSEAFAPPAGDASPTRLHRSMPIVREPRHLRGRLVVALLAAAGVAFAGPAVAQEPPQERTVFYPEPAHPPEETEITVPTAGTGEVPFISTGDYHSAGFVAEGWEVSAIGFLAERRTETVVPARISPLITLHDPVYLAVTRPGEIAPGDRVQLVREEAALPGVGLVFRVSGMVRVVEVEGTTATGEVVEVYHAIREGDLVLPVTPFPVAPGVTPMPVENGVEGRILAFQEPTLIPMTQNVVFVDLGAASGIREGDELLAFIPEQLRDWGLRPEIPVATLRVVRVTGQAASARVHALELPALEAGLPVRLVGRMP